MSVFELFCDVDDFMLSLEPQWKASQHTCSNDSSNRNFTSFHQIDCKDPDTCRSKE
jgi:hypothetical protein